MKSKLNQVLIFLIFTMSYLELNALLFVGPNGSWTADWARDSPCSEASYPPTTRCYDWNNDLQGWVEYNGIAYQPESDEEVYFELIQAYNNMPQLNGLAPIVVLKRDIQVITAGVKDDFLSPVDPASPSTYLTSRIVNAGSQMADFDTSIQNAHRGHTFILPGDYDKYASATLRTKLQAGGGGNDQISLEFHDINGFDLDNRWGELLSDLVPNWAAETTTLNLNLFSLPDSGGGANTRNLMPFINSKQFLDVRVQDDTNVDFYELILSKNDFISIEIGGREKVYAMRANGNSVEAAFAGSFVSPVNGDDIMVFGMAARNELIEFPPIHPTLVGQNGGVFTEGDFGMWSLILDPVTYDIKDFAVQTVNISELSYGPIEDVIITGETVPFMPAWAYMVLSVILPYIFIKRKKLIN